MNPVTLVLIGLGLAGVWFYTKYAAAKTTASQSPILSVPQGSTAANILSSLGIATKLIPGVTSASTIAETQAYVAASTTPGALTQQQLYSGQDVGATQQQTAAATPFASGMEELNGDPSLGMIQSTSGLLPQDDDSVDPSSTPIT